jgi:predicted RNA binding protein YcfA (HicA-like mRNA interferase family)
MPPFGPIKRSELIRHLRKAGFEGPYAGTKHEFMIRGTTTLRIPNPHQRDVGKELLARLLRQARITKQEWDLL